MNTTRPLNILATAVVGVIVAAAAQTQSAAQAPAAGSTPPPPVKLGAAELQKLVAPIALYPDALIAHILPASTAGLDVVQAARFLRKNDGKAEPKPDAYWNTSVFVLLQFPDVLYRMDENLEWTEKLGHAVIAQQADVLKAIQDVRTTATANGALQSNDKQTVVVTQEVVNILPANPEVIYVPADYRSSGVMTFLVSHLGKVLEKDLGSKTQELVKAMDVFEPDVTWQLVQ